MLPIFAYEYATKNAYLSPLGWPCIYSRCSINWIVTRIRSHWTGFSVIRIGFGSGFRKNSLLGIIFLPYWRGSNWRCSVIIFLSLLMRFGWIGRIIYC